MSSTPPRQSTIPWAIEPRIQSPSEKESAMLRITSTAFGNEEVIPTKHTCEGEDISPALQWGSNESDESNISNVWTHKVTLIRP